MNKVIIIGRLGRDPELRYTQTGTPACTFSIATDESYIDRDGNKVNRAEWHRIVTYQKTAENCAQYLAKGSQVCVEGSLATRKWQDQQGQDRYTTEIKAQRVQFLERKNAESGQSTQKEGSRPPQDRRAPADTPPDDYGPAFPSESAAMDEVPF